MAGKSVAALAVAAQPLTSRVRINKQPKRCASSRKVDIVQDGFLSESSTDETEVLLRIVHRKTSISLLWLSPGDFVVERNARRSRGLGVAGLRALKRSARDLAELGLYLAANQSAAAARVAGWAAMAFQSRAMLGRKAAAAIVDQTTISTPGRPIFKIGGMGMMSRATVNTMAKG